MIHAQHIHFTYPALHPQHPATTLFHDLTLSSAGGETVVVTGAGGSGKSTLCHLLAGLTHYTGGRVSGDLHVAGYPILTQPPPVGVIGVLFQDAATQLFNHTAEDEVAWGLEALGMPASEIGPQVAAALEHFGLLAERTRPPWMLSGGQQKRLALAAIWAMHPRLLLLDDPLGGLDPAGQVEVLETVATLHQHGVTILMTTQHPQAIALASQWLLLENGTAHALSSPGATARLINAGVIYPPERWPNLRLQRAGATAGSAAGEDALELAHVDFRYPDGHTALRDVNLRIPRGQFVALVGSNGAGKSTLIRHFNGLLSPTRGTVRVLGRDVTGRAVGELARDVGFLFQRPEQQLFAATVRAEIAYGLRQLRLPDPDARIEIALARFDLNGVADVPPATLNYGAQRAVTLAAQAALDTPILVLDEPTVGLDGRGWARLLDWLAERRAAGVTVVLVTHEMSLAACADRVVALDAGQVVADGSPDEVIPQPPTRVAG
ncbi:MAG: ABC transporter ATP-binding protein [Anaerolineae bacterium]|nr:ABC transporter ATP-binding protein [Anaerolineae bacterium]